MSKIISYSQWNALNIPNGITFDETNGVFSGTPSVNEGEYVVPVSVITNYGSDAKHLKIVVENRYHGVYALGSQAARWSNYASPDAYGFRKLDIPDANRLSTIPAGFAAKCMGGRWFIGSSKSDTIYGGNGKSTGISYYMPTEFPADYVLDIKGGRNSNSSGLFFAFTTQDDTSVFSYNLSSGNVSSSLSNSRVDISKLADGFSYGFAMLKLDNSIVLGNPSNFLTSSFSFDEHISKFVPLITLGNGAYNKVYFISEAGKLFEFLNGNFYQLLPDLQGFSDLWIQYSWDNVFALTSDKTLYARGNNAYYQLGINNPAVFNDFQLVGEFDVKKIEHTFMLTRDGKLYHTGTLSDNAASIAGGTHEGWTHIFPEYRFFDFSYSPQPASNFGSQTLVVILDD